MVINVIIGGIMNFNDTPFAGENWVHDATLQGLTLGIATVPENGNIIEIGSWKGRSASIILQSHPTINLFCVDTWKGSKEHNLEKDTDLFFYFFHNMRSMNLFSRIVPLRIMSSDILKYFEPKSIDMIFIDGSHEPDDVRTDLKNASILIKDSGIIIGDDYSWEGTAKVVEDFMNTQNNYKLSVISDKCYIVSKV